MKEGKLLRQFTRYLDNELSADEARELFRELAAEQDLSSIRQLIRDKITKLDVEESTGDPAMQRLYDRVFQKIKAETGAGSETGYDPKTINQPETVKQIVSLPERKQYTIGKYGIRSVAAVILILVCLGGYWFFSSPDNQEQHISKTLRAENDIAPGGNKAVLILADGARVILDEAGVGALAEQEGVAIEKTKDGQIVYDASLLSDKSEIPVSYNTVSTPRGGQYQVVLPDGTKVWLNAASSLQYPTVFTGDERRVRLKGEGYFEVAHDETRPFFVNSGEKEIQVLGTAFNVMAYPEEKDFMTTLLNGSLKVSSGDDTRLLKPGQQARVANQGGKINVLPVNTNAAVAWKDGQFVFEGEKLQSIMRKISRWYDVKIVYQGEVTDNDFIGTVSRAENVSEVLKTLELTGTVQFKIEGAHSGAEERRIIVMR